VYIAKDPKRNREQVRIYSLKFPPKEIESKVSIMQDIRKSIMDHEKGSEVSVENQETEDESEVNIDRVKVKFAVTFDFG
jgi:hypothetical protein